METSKEKGELIDKYLNYFERLEILSLKSYAETGKVSGSLYLAVNKLLDEYAESKTAQLQADKAELLEALEDCKERLENMNKRLIEVDGYSRLSVYFASKLNSLIQKHKQ